MLVTLRIQTSFPFFPPLQASAKPKTSHLKTMAPHDNLKLLFFLFSLLASITTSQYDYSLDNDDDPPSPQPKPFAPTPSPFSTPKLEANAIPSPQANVFTPIQSPSPAQEPIQSPSPSPSQDDSIDSNRYVSFPSSIFKPQSNEVEQDDGQFSIRSSMTKSSPKVKEICEATDHPKLCQSTIAPLLGGKTDISSVLEVAIDVTDKLANVGLSLAKSIADKPGNPSELDSILKDCRDSYDTVVYNFESAKSAFPERDIGTMNSMLSAVITNVGDCDDAFASSGMDSPFAIISEKLTNMTSNCLAIASLMS